MIELDLALSFSKPGVSPKTCLSLLETTNEFDPVSAV
jgi:hypothetical protein